MRQKLVCRQKVRIEEEKRIAVREIFRKRRKQQLTTTSLSSLRLGSPHTMLPASPIVFVRIIMPQCACASEVYGSVCVCVGGGCTVCVN